MEKLSAVSGALSAEKALNEPLLTLPSTLSSVGDDDGNDDDDDEQSPPPISMSPKDVILGFGLGGLGIVASMVALIAVPGAPVVMVMGALCIMNSPVVATRQIVIAKSAGVRDAVNMIRGESAVLRATVEQTRDAVDELQAQADAVTGVEQKLRTISEEQGVNVKGFVELVKENELILKQMKTNMKQTFMAAMTHIVMISDTDGNMKIDLHELPKLSIRLQMQVESMGIKLDTSLFEALIRENNDITHVLKFCGDILLEDALDKSPDGNDENDDDDSIASDDTQVFDLESFRKSLKGEEECQSSDKKEAALPPPTTLSREQRKTLLGEMLTIDDKYTHGSVESARGKRVTITSRPRGVENRVKRESLVNNTTTKQKKGSKRRKFKKKLKRFRGRKK